MGICLENRADPLVIVTRGDVVERIHYGHMVVVDIDRNIIFSKGDPYKYTYMRSCAKPIQAMPLVTSGAMDHFNFNDVELAIMCASHYGEPYHLTVLNSILKKTGLNEADLNCGDASSLSPAYATELARSGIDPRPLFNDCSGKHLGMLAYTLFQNYPIKQYIDFNGRTQTDIKSGFSQFCEYAQKNITLGIDGCSAPVFALPLYHMALAYLKMSNPDLISEKKEREAANRIFDAMINYPQMISGSDGFCTELIRHSHGKLIGKIGAEGVYCVGVRSKGIAIAVKMDDGNMDVLSSIIVEMLTRLNVFTEEEKKNLEKFRIRKSLNDRKIVVGFQKPFSTL